MPSSVIVLRLLYLRHRSEIFHSFTVLSRVRRRVGGGTGEGRWEGGREGRGGREVREGGGRVGGW